jgi:hypothetical protein
VVVNNAIGEYDLEITILLDGERGSFNRRPALTSLVEVELGKGRVLVSGIVRAADGVGEDGVAGVPCGCRLATGP